MSSATSKHDACVPTWLNRGRIPSLDGARALAVVLVIFAHWAFPGADFRPLLTFKGRCGFLGVQIFFVLSGFLVTTLMLREIARDGRLGLLAFYRRRALRILPAYVVFLGVLLVFQLAGAWRLSGLSWAALLTYTVNFPLSSLPWQTSHVWSLCVEEHFYVLWPLLLWLLPPDSCRRAALAALVGAFLLRWGVLTWWPKAPVDLWTPTRIDDIAAGCLLAFAARDPVARYGLVRLSGSAAAMTCAVAVFALGQVFLSRAVGGRLFGQALLPPLLALAHTVSSLSIALFTWWVVTRPHGLPGRWMNAPLATGIGAISYSLYLWNPLFHPPASGAWYSEFPMNLVLAVLAALVSYQFVERPFLRLKDRAARREPARVPAPARVPYSRPKRAAGESVPAPEVPKAVHAV